MDFRLGALLDATAAPHPSAPAFDLRSGRVTYGELNRRCWQVAHGLAALGVRRGDRVGFVGPNSTAWAETVVGAAKLGAVAVPVNTRLLGAEQAAILDDAQARALVAAPDAWEGLRPHVDLPGSSVKVLGSGYDSWRDRQAATSTSLEVGPDDDALQMYTSGTTGVAKGVRLTNRNLGWLITRGTPHVGMRPGLRGLVTLPQFHIAGGGFTLNALYLGGAVTLPADLTIDGIVSDIAEFRITNTGLVPTTMQTILDRPGFNPADLASLTDVIYGAAPIPASLLNRVLEQIGCGFYHTYGLTETTGFITVMTPHEHDPGVPRRLQSCGRALPWVELAVCDPSGNRVPTGELGELCVRSPQVSPGYWRRPEATEAARHPGEFFRTGDIGRIDADGFVFIIDRLKELIITGGENVAPAEVESVLAEHPAVSRVAVIGAADEHWGETVVAVVVPAEGAEPDGAALIAFARQRLAHFKCPTAVRFVDAMPLNATGKVDKPTLRAMGVSKA